MTTTSPPPDLRPGALNTEMRRMRLSDLTLLDDGQNARYMTNQQLQRLVDNIKEDGCLTSVPLAQQLPDGTLLVLSGNHRVEAAIEALGPDTEVDVMVTLDDLPRARQVALQLSHNSIVGQDDPVILKALYEEIEDIDWREYAGLDDDTLGLLDKIDIAALSEPNLEFQSLSIMFLPHELEAAKAVMDDAVSMIRSGDERWAALYQEHDRLLDALDLTTGAYDIRDRASALAIILAIFEKHSSDLKDGFVDPTGQHAHDGWVPVATITATDRLPAQVAAKLSNAAERMIGNGEIKADERWQVIDRLVDAYMAQGKTDG